MSVHAYRPTNGRVMILGDAPGENEVDKGRPFVGYSGQLPLPCWRREALTGMTASSPMCVGNVHLIR